MMSINPSKIDYAIAKLNEFGILAKGTAEAEELDIIACDAAAELAELRINEIEAWKGMTIQSAQIRDQNKELAKLRTELEESHIIIQAKKDYQTEILRLRAEMDEARAILLRVSDGDLADTDAALFLYAHPEATK